MCYNSTIVRFICYNCAKFSGPSCVQGCSRGADRQAQQGIHRLQERSTLVQGRRSQPLSGPHGRHQARCGQVRVFEPRSPERFGRYPAWSGRQTYRTDCPKTPARWPLQALFGCCWLGAYGIVGRREGDGVSWQGGILSQEIGNARRRLRVEASIRRAPFHFLIIHKHLGVKRLNI